MQTDKSLAIGVKHESRYDLDFYRNETHCCSEQAISGDFDIARNLPARLQNDPALVHAKESERI